MAAELELLEGEWEMPHSASCSCSVCRGRGAGELAFEAEAFMKHSEIEEEDFLGPWRAVERSITICPECGGKIKLLPRNTGAIDAMCSVDKCNLKRGVQIKALFFQKLNGKFPGISKIKGGRLKPLNNYRNVRLSGGGSKEDRCEFIKAEKDLQKGNPPHLILVLYNKERAEGYYFKTTNKMIIPICMYEYDMRGVKPISFCTTDRKGSSLSFKEKKWNSTDEFRANKLS